MALKIEQKHGILNVTGILTSANANRLKNHFNRFLKKADAVILNLEGITKIETTGAYTVEQLYLDFAKNNRIISIIGKENKAIVNVMKATKTSYIFSNDRI